ncbi:MAG: 50S ribosomal protein L18 [Candidatus Zixiibacteriota bacterium]|nr:MAG: 50S ribosomal protein L18 [candidate division Zixibacteria bacterium]
MKKAQRRRKRVRKSIVGTPDCPRLTVAKSLKNVFAQIIDDVNHVTLAAVATNSKVIAKELKDDMTKTQKARQAGLALARLAKEKGVERVVFDRNVSRYHGRVKAVAEGAREGGLKF